MVGLFLVLSSVTKIAIKSIYIIEESFFSSLFLFSLIHFIMISTVQGGKCVRGVSLRGGKQKLAFVTTFRTGDFSDTPRSEVLKAMNMTNNLFSSSSFSTLNGGMTQVFVILQKEKCRSLSYFSFV